MEILPSLPTERIESFKAGMIAAIAFIFFDAIVLLFNTYVLSIKGTQFSYLQTAWEIKLLIRFVIAWISGFLFGVTYRYIIRDDRNSHLKDGAVLAFGLVRGLTILEESSIFWIGSVLLVQSIICFGCARLSLDLALKYKLIKPFVL